LIVQLAASGFPHADPFKSRHSSHAGQKGDINERQLMAQCGHAASTLFKFACAGPRLIDAYALFAKSTDSDSLNRLVFLRRRRNEFVLVALLITFGPCIGGCKPRHRRLILSGPMALKEAFALEAVAPDFPLRAGGLLGLRPKAFYATSSDLVAINNVLRSRTKWSLPRIPQE